MLVQHNTRLHKGGELKVNVVKETQSRKQWGGQNNQELTGK